MTLNFRTSAVRATIVLALAASACTIAARAQDGAHPTSAYGPVAARPFRSVALSARVGSGGLGGELAVPVFPHLALRAGAQFFGYSTTFSADSVNANGRISLNNVYAVADFFPFRRSTFHLSPGLGLRAANTLNANFLIPAGQTLTLNDSDYTSAVGDPISGTARLGFGNNPTSGGSTKPFPVAPRLTAGFGSMFPASGRRFSFPSEIGFEYHPQPTLSLNLSGSGCNADGCGPINDPANMANVNGEIAKLNHDIAPLRFYPIVSFGVAVRIGRLY